LDVSAQQPQFFSTQVREARRFYLELAPAPTRPLAVLCGGFENCAPNYVIDREDFPYYSLEFVRSGKGRLTLDGISTDLQRWVAYTYGPRITHKIVADPDDPLEKYFVDFAGTEVLRLLEEAGLGPGVIRHVHVPLAIQRALDDLIQHGSRGGRSASKLCDALMQYILLLVSAGTAPVGTHLSPAYSTYIRCREHIEEHFLRLESLDAIAKETFVDKTYLCRMFRRFDNQTPYQLLTRLKMNKAAEMLEDTDKMVKQVAISLGYANAFHFSRTFKSTFGISPKEFRRLRSSL
jgi:AraC-like DNA-binding protein